MPRRRSLHPRTSLTPESVHHLVGTSIADALRAASELGIEVLLASRPWTTAELASHTGRDPRWLESVLRGLANLALIRRVDVEHLGSLWSTNQVGEHVVVRGARLPIDRPHLPTWSGAGRA
jgi:hypothetical protein